MFNGKIDKFKLLENEISNLNSSKLEYLNKIEELNKQIDNKIGEKLDYGLQYFLDKGKRENLLNEARQYGYSEKKLSELIPFIENWNQDIITNDVIDSFRIIEKFVNDNQKPYKGNIMYKISKIFSNEGGNIDED